MNELSTRDNRIVARMWEWLLSKCFLDWPTTNEESLFGCCAVLSHHTVRWEQKWHRLRLLVMLSSNLLRGMLQHSIIGFNSHSFNDAVNNVALLQTPVCWGGGVGMQLYRACYLLWIAHEWHHLSQLLSAHTPHTKSVASFLESSHWSYLFIFCWRLQKLIRAPARTVMQVCVVVVAAAI